MAMEKPYKNTKFDALFPNPFTGQPFTAKQKGWLMVLVGLILAMIILFLGPAIMDAINYRFIILSFRGGI